MACFETSAAARLSAFASLSISPMKNVGTVRAALAALDGVDVPRLHTHLRAFFGPSTNACVVNFDQRDEMNAANKGLRDTPAPRRGCRENSPGRYPLPAGLFSYFSSSGLETGAGRWPPHSLLPSAAYGSKLMVPTYHLIMQLADLRRDRRLLVASLYGLVGDDVPSLQAAGRHRHWVHTH